MMRQLKEKWKQERKGFQLKAGWEWLQNLRFADDLLLIASSQSQVKSMLQDLSEAAARVGLELHMGKTKVLSNGVGPGNRSSKIAINGQDVEVIPAGGSTMYLGRALSLRCPHDAEISQRIARAWAKFGTFKKELTNRSYSLQHRMKLFHTVVTPTVLYGCGSWVMTRAREQKLRTAQRRMLRAILGKGRSQLDAHSDADSHTDTTVSSHDSDNLESWVDWIHRVTEEAIAAMARAGVPDWIEEQQRRKWRWAGHVCRRYDGRWTKQVLEWTPSGGHRRQGHPFSRWCDDINGFISTLDAASSGDEAVSIGVWSATAQDRAVWAQLEDDYVNYCYERWH